jgi:hypothetical protein
MTFYGKTVSVKIVGDRKLQMAEQPLLVNFSLLVYK